MATATRKSRGAAKPKRAAPNASKGRAAKAQTAKARPASDGGIDAFLAGLDHPLKADIEAVRRIMLAAPGVSEGVKWNSVSFRKADWFATVNLRSKDVVQLVFHTGAKVKDNPEFEIPDPSGLLLWLAKDRALATLGAGKTLKANAKAFEAIVKAWVKYV